MLIVIVIVVAGTKGVPMTVGGFAPVPCVKLTIVPATNPVPVIVMSGEVFLGDELGTIDVIVGPVLIVSTPVAATTPPSPLVTVTSRKPSVAPGATATRTVI